MIEARIVVVGWLGGCVSGEVFERMEWSGSGGNY
jgi:hypothetical protein